MPTSRAEARTSAADRLPPGPQPTSRTCVSPSPGPVLQGCIPALVAPLGPRGGCVQMCTQVWEVPTHPHKSLRGAGNGNDEQLLRFRRVGHEVWPQLYLALGPKILCMGLPSSIGQCPAFHHSFIHTFVRQTRVGCPPWARHCPTGGNGESHRRV